MFFEEHSIEQKITLDYHDFDIDRFNQAVFDHGVRTIRAAGRAFCKELVKRVPVWSGMALASLRPLARAVRFALPIVPVDGAPDRRALGESLGGSISSLAPGANMFSSGADMVFSFEWKTLVKHFNINEQMNVNTLRNPKTGKRLYHLKHPGPWHAIPAAQEAAQEEIDKRISKCPKPTDYSVHKILHYNPKINALGEVERVLTIDEAIKKFGY